jgi:hypothetical protein
MPISSTIETQTEHQVIASDLEDTPAPIKRMLAYQIRDELNCLYDDIKQGLFGEAAKTGSFVEYVERIKAEYPKE